MDHGNTPISGSDDFSDEVAEFVHQGEPVEFKPFAALGRLMRGRMLVMSILALVFGLSLGVPGYLSGTALYEAQGILRLSANESEILFDGRDDAKLKLFTSFVNAEATVAASHPVMQRAADEMHNFPSPMAQNVSPKDLAKSISIQRKEALIILKTNSKDPVFAALKINSVMDAYMALHEESKEKLASYRSSELAAREYDLLNRLDAIKSETLLVGGEFGMASLVKTHIEKVTQIEALVARQGEVSATLATLESQDGAGSADMADQEIMRATLLDRALADLNFDKAKREAELTTLLKRYADGTPKVAEKREEIAIINRAMADRRDQIKVLGQTGALTEGGESSREESIAEIKALLDKVSEQLQTARDDARELNRKRIELTFLEEERDETRRMLDETRRALDVVRLESRNSMAGLIEIMTPAVVPDRPAKDSAKMLGAGGFVGGAFLAVIVVFGYAVSRRTVRFTDDLWRHVGQMPILAVTKAKADAGAIRREVLRLRNNILLFPSRRSVRRDRAKVIAVNHFDKGDSRMMAKALADSFASANLPTLFIDADLENCVSSDHAGWRELVHGVPVTAQTGEGADAISCGLHEKVSDDTVSVVAVRSALSHYTSSYAVIVINAGSLDTGLSSELIVSASDLVIGVVAAGDAAGKIDSGVARIDSLSRQGGGFVFTGATRKDPALAA